MLKILRLYILARYVLFTITFVHSRTLIFLVGNACLHKKLQLK